MSAAAACSGATEHARQVSGHFRSWVAVIVTPTFDPAAAPRIPVPARETANGAITRSAATLTGDTDHAGNRRYRVSTPV
jgi:hypothetical protein